MLKKNITKTSKQHAFIIIACLLFVGIGVWLAATWYQHNLNPDATSYFTIAQKYAHGHLKSAVNGYWSPLLSWLLVPFVWLGSDLIIGARILALLCGAGLLAVLYYMLRNAGVRPPIVYLTCVAAVPILLTWAVTGPITPDILFTLLLLLLVAALLKFMSQPRIRFGAILGAIGASMYFTKAVGLYLFLGVIVLIAGWQWYHHKPGLRVLARRFVPVLATLALLILPFVTLLTLKYHRLTVNTGADYNFSVVGPYMEWRHPLSVDAFAPPNDTALGAWEDPTLMAATMRKWSPLDSFEHFGYFMYSILLKNIIVFIEAMYAFGPHAIIGTLLFIMGAMGTVWRRQYRLFALLSAMLVAGYATLALEARYVWAIGIFALISIALLAHQLHGKKIFSMRQIVIAGTIGIVISFVSFGHLIDTTKGAENKITAKAMSFRRLIPEKSHILADDYNLALIACWNDNLKCYGTLKPPTQSDYPSYYQRLVAMETKYYISYKPESQKDENLQRFLGQYFTLISADEAARVYVLK